MKKRLERLVRLCSRLRSELKPLRREDDSSVILDSFAAFEKAVFEVYSKLVAYDADAAANGAVLFYSLMLRSTLPSLLPAWSVHLLPDSSLLFLQLLQKTTDGARFEAAIEATLHFDADATTAANAYFVVASRADAGARSATVSFRCGAAELAENVAGILKSLETSSVVVVKAELENFAAAALTSAPIGPSEIKIESDSDVLTSPPFIPSPLTPEDSMGERTQFEPKEERKEDKMELDRILLPEDDDEDNGEDNGKDNDENDTLDSEPIINSIEEDATPSSVTLLTTPSAERPTGLSISTRKSQYRLRSSASAPPLLPEASHPFRDPPTPDSHDPLPNPPPKKRSKPNNLIKAFPCRLCGIKVTPSRGLSHLVDAHGVEGLECCFCPSSFSLVEDLKSHLKTHHWPYDFPPKATKNPLLKAFPCRICGVHVTYSRGLSHLRDAHGVVGFECCFCPKTFVDEKVYKTHIKIMHYERRDDTPSGPPPKNHLPCRFCGAMINPTRFFDHSAREHDRPGECSFCDFEATPSAEKLVDGEDVDLDLLVLQSNEGLTPSERLRRHVNQTHGPPKEKERDDIQQNKDQCSDKIVKKIKEVCARCGILINKDSMKRHMTSAHPSDATANKSKKFRCQVCARTFSIPHKLKIHMTRVHFRQKCEFSCQVCKKGYPDKTSLKTHLLSHGEKRFKCPKCDKPFATLSNTVQHLRIHVPPRFECLDCHKTFFFSPAIRNHLAKEHPFAEANELILKRHVPLDKSAIEKPELF